MTALIRASHVGSNVQLAATKPGCALVATPEQLTTQAPTFVLVQPANTD